MLEEFNKNTMTQEDKELLIKDLCARLPYGIKAQDYDDEPPFTIVAYDGLCFWDDDEWEHKVDKIKPYLFPLSSITEEQIKEFNSITQKCNTYIGKSILLTDFCNKHHIDWRGFIERGIALDATNKNIY